MYKIYTKILCWPGRRIVKSLLALSGGLPCLDPSVKRQLIMSIKLTVIIFITGLVQVYASTYAQELNLSRKGITLKQVFKEVKLQTGYDVFYKSGKFRDTERINADFHRTPLNQVMKVCLENQNMDFVLFEKSIIIKVREQPIPETVKTSLQIAVIVTGKVTDTRNQPIPGVSVKVKGSAVATSSSSTGEYRLKIPEDSGVLIFSSVGYLSKEITLSPNTTVINVQLEEDNKSLNDVVVVGYGTQRKSSLTAAISTVKMDDIRNVPRPDIVQSLAGRVPGLTIQETNSEPGSTPGILIRGVGTIDGATSPLILIDGTPSTNLSTLAPSDIESISVLKDAAAAAIYGARAANGVLLVTTKKGGEMDRAIIEFNSYVGIQSPTRFPGTVSAYEYASMLNEALKNEGKAPVYSDNDLRLFQDGTDPIMHANTNWLEEVTQKNAPVVNNYLSANGNSKIGRYFLSGEYLYQKGSVKYIDHYKRINLRANVTSQLSEKLQLQLLTSFQNATRDAQGTMNIFSNALRASATAAVKYPNGYYGGEMFANGDKYTLTGNQVQQIENYGPVENNMSNYTVNGSLEYKPIPGLTLKLLGVYQATIGDSTSYVRKGESYSFIERTLTYGRNSLTEKWGKTRKYDLQATANYEKTFGDHSFKLLGGFSQEAFRGDWISAYRADFINDELFELNAGDAATQTNSGRGDHWAFMSGFGRVNYSLKDRYLFEFTGRYDGSSRLAQGHRWGFFPSASIGWNLQKENFLSRWKPLDLLKLRFSVGQLGNAEKLSLYESYATLNTGPYYSFNDKQVVGVLFGNAGNPGLKWETSTTYNLGMDASFKNGLFGFEVDFWKKRTDDILLTVPVSTIIGLPTASITTNAGSVGSHGFDLTISHANQVNEDFSYNASFTISGWRSWIIDLKGRATPFGDRLRPNGDLGDRFGYEAIGIINTDEQLLNYKNMGGDGVVPQIGLGDLMYKDQNGDGRIDYMDKVKIANEYVKTQFGLNLGGRYKSFDISIFFQGAANTDRVWDGYARNILLNNNSPLAISLDRWTTENRNADAANPRLLQNFGHNRVESSWWWKTGAYVRLKNLQLGYNLPKKAVRSLKIQGLRAYVAGSNLFTYAPNYVDGFDPERDIYDQWYPNFRVLSLGINLRF